MNLTLCGYSVKLFITNQKYPPNGSHGKGGLHNLSLWEPVRLRIFQNMISCCNFSVPLPGHFINLEYLMGIIYCQTKNTYKQYTFLAFWKHAHLLA
jgi:hypothetical protein